MSSAAVIAAAVTVAGTAVNNNQSRVAANRAANKTAATSQDYQAQILGPTGNINDKAISGLQQLAGGNIDTQAFLAQHPEFQEGWDNNAGSDQTAWLKRAIDAAGYIDQSTIPRTGGIGDITNQLNSQNRAWNLNDVSNLAGQYSDILHGTNAAFYNQANNYTNAANAPIQGSLPQMVQGWNAINGFNNNPTANGLNAQYQQMLGAAQSNQGTPIQGQMLSGSDQGHVLSNGDPVLDTNGNPVLDKNGNPQTVTQGPTSDAGVNMTGQLPAAATAPITRSDSAYGGVSPTGGMNLGYSNLQNGQNQVALNLLNQGGNLSASDLRNVQQASRAGFAARGLDATNASVADEVMQTDAASRARLLQNLGIVQGIQNQGLGEQTNLQNYGLNLNSQNLNAASLQNTALNQSMTLAEQQRQNQLYNMGNAASIQGQGNLDPYAAILNGTQNNIGNALQLYGINQNALNGLYDTTANAAYAANNSAANNAAAGNAAMYGALGKVAGAYFGSQNGNTDNSISKTYDLYSGKLGTDVSNSINTYPGSNP